MWKDKLCIDFFPLFNSLMNKEAVVSKMVLLGEKGHHLQSILNHSSLLGVFSEVNRLLTTEAHLQKVHSVDCSSNWSKGEPYASISMVLLPTVQQN